MVWGGCIRSNTKMAISWQKMVRFSIFKKGLEEKIVLYHLRIWLGMVLWEGRFYWGEYGIHFFRAKYAPPHTFPLAPSILSTWQCRKCIPSFGGDCISSFIKMIEALVGYGGFHNKSESIKTIILWNTPLHIFWHCVSMHLSCIPGICLEFWLISDDILFLHGARNLSIHSADNFLSLGYHTKETAFLVRIFHVFQWTCSNLEHGITRKAG